MTAVPSSGQCDLGSPQPCSLVSGYSVNNHTFDFNNHLIIMVGFKDNDLLKNLIFDTFWQIDIN